jgi:hypothetical protein
MLWFPGAHCTFGLHPQVRHFIEDSLRASGLGTGRPEGEPELTAAL